LKLQWFINFERFYKVTFQRSAKAAHKTQALQRQLPILLHSVITRFYTAIVPDS